MLTQVGGIIYLFNIFFYKFYSKASTWLKRISLKLTGFLVLYLSMSFFVIPSIATYFGRTPLPLFTENNVRPLNILTCLLNRHYVTPSLKATLIDIANKTNDKFPGMTINYLDANFPFLKNFPLFPHLSHNDGKKIDVSFCYIDSKTNQPTNESPAFLGYGICEEPLPGEENMPNFCEAKGFWQYNFISNITPQGNKKNFVFDSEKTKFMVNAFARNTNVSKVFIEPHLKQRLRLTDSKVKFHGCHAVRHDDHIHIQVY